MIESNDSNDSRIQRDSFQTVNQPGSGMPGGMATLRRHPLALHNLCEHYIKMTDISVREFVALQRNLLELELKAEEEEERSIESSIRAVPSKHEVDERPAHVLRHLETSEISVGLYGRTVVTLTVMNAKDETELLPAHRFSVGDEVEIHSKTGNRDNVGGVICAITETSIAIALFGKKTVVSKNDENNGEEDDSVLGPPPLAVIPKSSVEVHRKLVKALGELERQGSDHPIAGNVVSALFGPPKSFAKCPPTTIEPFNSNLDASQLEAISFALNSGDRPISLIHGPPGTGKTTTVAELIQQAVHMYKFKVLVTAPSNVAVDNVLERLVVNQSTSMTKRSKRKSLQRLKAVRLGHPARMKASILPYSLESLVQNADGTEIVSDVRDELQSFLRILTNPKSRGADKRVAYREVKALRKEVRTREEKVVKDLVSEAHVILATNVGAAHWMLKDVEFDLVVIDEAAQSLEASCWIPILRGKRLILAGDHCQLPPTIKSNTPGVQKGLGKTLFERTMEMYGDSNSPNSKGTVSRMLRVQYRMHLDIANWASAAMYHGQLETHDSVKSLTLGELPHIRDTQDGIGEEIGEMRMLLIDTAGCDMHETVNAAGSRYNDGEAQIVSQHIQTLLAMGLKQEEIAVISPYNGQVELLRTMLLPDAPKLEIRSVDGFQGGEREAVVMSLVRSSDCGGAAGIGFLKDDRRLNVAVTRAKRHCAVVCDSETVSQSEFVKGLIEWMEEYGVHQSAFDYLSLTHDNDVEGDIRAAEIELQRMMDATTVSTNNATAAKPKKQAEAKDDGPTEKMKMAASDAILEREHKVAGEERRKGLLDSIALFAESGQSGEEMQLSPELSRFDRRVVHEFATQLGLDHLSEGVEGVDRRIILTIKKAVATSQNEEPIVSESKTIAQDDIQDDKDTRPPGFAVLNVDSDDSSESGGVNAREEAGTADKSPAMNKLLGDLAKERLQRQQQAKKAVGHANVVAGGGKKKERKKKLGNNKTKPVNEASTIDDAPKEMDDMAFLNTQIEKVQTSHGRKVEGKGEYLSLIHI